MDLEIINIEIQGDEDAEYVYMRVINDCNLHYYMIFDTSYTSEHSISNKSRHPFWFPPYEVKKGEYVSLRTGRGAGKKLVNDKGQTIHRFYWGLKEPVWNNDGDAAVLMHISAWKTTRAV